MKLTSRSEYALLALVYLARSNATGYVSAETIAEAQKIPAKFLEQILLALRHGGLLTSKRGVGGGYALRVEASRITVGEVIRIMDGPVALVPCAGGGGRAKCTCPDPRTCPLRLFMTGVRQGLDSALDGCTLEELARLGDDPGGLAFEI